MEERKIYGDLGERGRGGGGGGVKDGEEEDNSGV